MVTIKLKNDERTQQVLQFVSKGFGSRKIVSINQPKLSTAKVSSESRYAGHQVVVVRIGSDREFRTIETWERPSIPTDTGNDKYFYVDSAYAYRSDLISNYAFGTPMYNWWVLISNNMCEDIQLKPGTTLRIIAPPGDRITSVQRRPF